MELLAPTRLPEVWNAGTKGQKTSFSHPVNILDGKKDISRDTQMNSSPNNANFSVPRVVYTPKINCGAKPQGEL